MQFRVLRFLVARSGWPPARAHLCPVALGPGLHRFPQLPEQEARIRCSEADKPASFALFQLILDAPELLQRSLQALHDLPRQDLEIGQFIGVLCHKKFLDANR